MLHYILYMLVYILFKKGRIDWRKEIGHALCFMNQHMKFY